MCLCEAVSSRSILEAIEGGARSVKDVGRANGAGTACGKCARNIHILIEQNGGTDPPDERGWRWRPKQRL